MKTRKQKYVIAFRKEGRDDVFLSFFMIRKPEIGLNYTAYQTCIDFDVSYRLLQALKFSTKRLARHIEKCVQPYIGRGISILLVDLETEKEILIGKGERRVEE